MQRYRVSVRDSKIEILLTAESKRKALELARIDLDPYGVADDSIFIVEKLPTPAELTYQYR